MPGAGCVDDGIRPHHSGTLPVLVANFEGCGFAAPGLEFIETDAADVGDAAGSMDVGRQGGLGGKRFEVALDQFGAGRIKAGFGRIPACGRQQARRRAVDIVFPGREQLNMTPLAHRMPGAVAGFQHDRPQPSLHHMRGRGKTDRAGPDDGNYLCFSHGILLLV